MNITIGQVTFSVDVLSCAPQFIQNIDWKDVSGQWRATDRGANTAGRSTNVLVSAPISEVESLFKAIQSAKIAGSLASVTPESGEDIFGPHIQTGTAFNAVLDADSETLDVTGETFFVGRLEIEINPLTALSSLYSSLGQYIPVGCAVISVERMAMAAGGLIRLEQGVESYGFGHSAPIAEVKLEGSREDIARALVYLESVRSQSIAWFKSTAKTWLFSPGILTPNVYILDVQYNERLDVAGYWHSCIVTLGEAP